MENSLRNMSYSIFAIMIIFSLTLLESASTVSVPFQQIGASTDENLVDKGLSTHTQSQNEAINYIVEDSKHANI